VKKVRKVEKSYDTILEEFNVD